MEILNVIETNEGSNPTVYSFVIEGQINRQAIIRNAKSLYVELALQNGCATIENDDDEEEEISEEDIEEFLLKESENEGSYNSDGYHIYLVWSQL